MKNLLAQKDGELLVSRIYQSESTQIEVKGCKIGGEQLMVVAGPCAVESEEVLKETAFKVRAAGAAMLRGGAFKPRTSPYSFQGLGEKGLKLLARVGEYMNMPVISEIMDSEDIGLLADYADILQVGARNMQNFALLRKLGQLKKPVVLKRGMSASIEEWLLAAEYILAGGNSQVILCERGIRTVEPWTRNTLDLSAVALVKQLSHLPVMVDPSHATGVRSLVSPMARAAIAAGADGLMVEVHPQPEKALSDGEQSLTPRGFSTMMREIEPVARAIGRRLR
ncbi:MAG: 3-deoxy-7-phosphoheptulonate synthase [Syntrophomonas sp.]|uniref:3-deoxy-7-phosphoheptulonate synthase n=1 Tax=Syntrophomonas sp. TaxID=2053627 RepID=UPI002638BF14|nr:3-deoxy-7-phosphoheptulonate synthase [Syntrophomonas sp.]MDD2509632.1 3-deoxy-7-phosphoheptulonate synthase [Syntrophomonas sp.]MDD3878947.1 3-deoxy-7-phosphoheptulonate synthase [Syntrophomonas sp.]MDD4625706.1 3-deoxy-7-phosphoheptulonate synthase [Syntrophomonas sp.]